MATYCRIRPFSRPKRASFPSPRSGQALEPDFDRPASRDVCSVRPQRRGLVCRNALIVPGSWPGRQGWGLNRAKLSPFSSLPTVRLWSRTPKRSAMTRLPVDAAPARHAVDRPVRLDLDRAGKLGLPIAAEAGRVAHDPPKAGPAVLQPVGAVGVEAVDPVAQRLSVQPAQGDVAMRTASPRPMASSRAASERRWRLRLACRVAAASRRDVRSQRYRRRHCAASRHHGIISRQTTEIHEPETMAAGIRAVAARAELAG